ncbi:type I-B CRISPR-associated protein Cas7/Csh2 [Ruminiclostridium herbifermentans]|uniref:Type I-B CRISPR-associated protein Cas7/Csh2 n=1 Tax=Ruminiclostridium herbifermentans TaxID=2488810 RepID=A0A4V6EMV8_9FIRM|nr:type I-B CRISPR-associated protein Cas7/Csh2 [Ruminiclostridium herbifermentans]QNU65555.1 type I-B CRISPR-associated protein Cas7/Csh2 [Ruminiclostridium herbifermentans]
MIVNNSEFLFLFEGTMTNPNGDPDQENKPRMDYETKTLLVSDVRRKRDCRDFLEEKGYDIFVATMNGTKVTMDKKFDAVLKKYGVDGKDVPEDKKIDAILDNHIDMRLFGSAMAVGGITKTFTGPVQISWGYSLHPVDLVKSSSIVTIMNDDSSTFGKMYKAHYALIAHSGSVNKYAAKKTRMSQEDLSIFRKSLVQSMMNNLTHSKQGQIPLMYLEVIYDENFDGYLGDLRRFIKAHYNPETPIRSGNDIKVDFSALSDELNLLKKKGYIKDVILWKSSQFTNVSGLPDAASVDMLDQIKAGR